MINSLFKLKLTLYYQTVDFFTPIVDDAYEFGAISAANALSDVYAMGTFSLFLSPCLFLIFTIKGGTPTTALNIVAFPTTRLPLSVLNQILKYVQYRVLSILLKLTTIRGAYDKAAEAGVPILGGHTIDDNEPKFGLSITGNHQFSLLRHFINSFHCRYCSS